MQDIKNVLNHTIDDIYCKKRLIGNDSISFLVNMPKKGYEKADIRKIKGNRVIGIFFYKNTFKLYQSLLERYKSDFDEQNFIDKVKRCKKEGFLLNDNKNNIIIHKSKEGNLFTSFKSGIDINFLRSTNKSLLVTKDRSFLLFEGINKNRVHLLADNFEFNLFLSKICDDKAIMCLHGAHCAIDSINCLFIGASKSGKSTICKAFKKNSESRVYSDDSVYIDFLTKSKDKVIEFYSDIQTRGLNSKRKILTENTCNKLDTVSRREIGMIFFLVGKNSLNSTISSVKDYQEIKKILDITQKGKLKPDRIRKLSEIIKKEKVPCFKLRISRNPREIVKIIESYVQDNNHLRNKSKRTL